MRRIGNEKPDAVSGRLGFEGIVHEILCPDHALISRRRGDLLLLADGRGFEQAVPGAVGPGLLEHPLTQLLDNALSDVSEHICEIKPHWAFLCSDRTVRPAPGPG